MYGLNPGIQKSTTTYAKPLVRHTGASTQISGHMCKQFSKSMSMHMSERMSEHISRHLSIHLYTRMSEQCGVWGIQAYAFILEQHYTVSSANAHCVRPSVSVASVCQSVGPPVSS